MSDDSDYAAAVRESLRQLGEQFDWHIKDRHRADFEVCEGYR